MYIRRKTSKEIANMVPPSDGIFQNVDAVVVLYYMTVAYVPMILISISCRKLRQLIKFYFLFWTMWYEVDDWTVDTKAQCNLSNLSPDFHSSCFRLWQQNISSFTNQICFRSRADTGVYFSTILKFFLKDQKVS